MDIIKKFINIFRKKRCSDAEFSKEYSFIPLLGQWLTPDQQKNKAEQFEDIGKKEIKNNIDKSNIE